MVQNKEKLLNALREAPELTLEEVAQRQGKVHPLDGWESREILLGQPRCRVHQGRLEVARIEGRGENRTVVYVPVGNFAARIARQLRIEDGSGEVDTWLEIEGWLHTGKRLPLARVRASEFGGMSWINREWGLEPVLYPGYNVRDLARAGIQLISLETYTTSTVYRHLGWTQVKGMPVYLHAGGGIGPMGSVEGLEVEPVRTLEGFVLPSPAEGDEEGDIWEVILREWGNIAPQEIAWPLLIYALAAPLGHSPFVLYLSGPTGARKTSLALVTQAFFARGVEAPPLGWEATANAIEGAAFAAKDALLLIDDYAPTGDEARRKELASKASRVIRSQGNATGRIRMRADGSLTPDRPPRGSLLITGEDLPPGHSIRARSFVLEVPRGAVNLSVLSRLQKMARDGLLAKAMASWIRYLASDLEFLKGRYRQRAEELRSEYAFSHGRTTDAASRLHAALELLLDYWSKLGLEVNAAPILKAIRKAASNQEEHQRDADPVERFPELLRALLSSGRAHLRHKYKWQKGEPPMNPAQWGWRLTRMGNKKVWQPLGQAIGWVGKRPEKEGIYLDPDLTYAALAQLAREVNLSLPTPRTFWKQLALKGLIRETVDGGKLRYTHKLRFGGQFFRVIVFVPPPSWEKEEDEEAQEESQTPSGFSSPSPYGDGERGEGGVDAGADEGALTSNEPVSVDPDVQGEDTRSQVKPLPGLHVGVCTVEAGEDRRSREAERTLTGVWTDMAQHLQEVLARLEDLAPPLLVMEVDGEMLPARAWPSREERMAHERRMGLPPSTSEKALEDWLLRLAERYPAPSSVALWGQWPGNPPRKVEVVRVSLHTLETDCFSTACSPAEGVKDD